MTPDFVHSRVGALGLRHSMRGDSFCHKERCLVIHQAADSAGVWLLEGFRVAWSIPQLQGDLLGQAGACPARVSGNRARRSVMPRLDK